MANTIETRAAIEGMLEKTGVFTGMFDIIRLVDQEKGLLLEFDPDGAVLESAITCTSIFGSNERCRNCTSMRAYYSDQTMVKLEYNQGSVLLILSVPVVLDGKRVVAELIKDITNSMTLDVKDKLRVDGVTQIIQNLNTIATTDALTGLYNRRYLDEHLPDIIEKTREIGQPVCIAMLDIDDFKRVNDTYGHQVGDRVLAATADSVQSFVRHRSDWAARYGGEELFACFVGVTLDNGVKILERVRQHVEENLVVFGNNSISVSVSIGLAEVRPGETMAEAIARCDSLLYQAKRNGKNRVEWQPAGSVGKRSARMSRRVVESVAVS